MKTKRGLLALVPVWLSHGVRKRGTSPLQSFRNWRWDLIVPIKKGRSYEEVHIGSPSLKTAWRPSVENLLTFFLSPSSCWAPLSTKGYR